MTIGILCGLQAEAKIADRLPRVLVGCSGARKERAQELVNFLIDKNVKRLISFGLAAGLSQDVEAGDLLLGATVVSDHGAWEADSAWNEKFIENLNCFQCAPIWGSDTLLATAKEKSSCAARSGCLAADMESHIVAQAAARARIPFNILRAVADPLAMDLPTAAMVPLMKDGRVDGRAVARAIWREPLQLVTLIKLGRNTSRALAALRNAVAVIGEMERGG